MPHRFSKASTAAAAQQAKRQVPRGPPNEPTDDLVNTAFGGNTDLSKCLVFYFIADFGDYNENESLAEAMELTALRSRRRPDLILNGGDAFYPEGAHSRAEFHSWRARFCQGALEGVPWHSVLGNHSWTNGADGAAAVELGFSKAPHPENPHRAWQMRGGLDEEPAPCYTVNKTLCASLSASSPSSLSGSAAAAAAAGAASSDDKKDVNNTNVSAAASVTCHFNLFDTNVTSIELHRKNPELVAKWPERCATLAKALAEQKPITSAAATQQAAEQQKQQEQAETQQQQQKQLRQVWKFVVGHHPCYSMGRGHKSDAVRLHTPLGKTCAGSSSMTGFGFEQILIDGQVDVYFAGHEHVQHVTTRAGGVTHVVGGATALFEVWGGLLNEHKFDWSGPMGKRGFVLCCVSIDAEKKTTSLSISFISVDAPVGAVLHTRTLTKPLAC